MLGHRMPTITSVRKNVKQQNRYSIFVDDEFVLSVNADIVHQYQLRKGIVFTAELLAKLRTDDERFLIRQKLWQYASYKPRTEKQVRAKLKTFNVSDIQADELLDWLRGFGLVDDTAFVRNFIQASYQQKPLSATDMIRRLVGKGIPASLAESIVSECVSDEQVLDSAVRVAKKKLSQLTSMQKDKIPERLQRFLAARGFPYHVIRTVISSLELPCLLLMMLTGSFFAKGQTTKVANITITAVEYGTMTPLPSAEYQVVITEDSRAQVTGAPVTRTVDSPVLHLSLLPGQKAEVLCRSSGYLSGRQTIRIQNIDNTTEVQLNTIMYKRDAPFCTVRFSAAEYNLTGEHEKCLSDCTIAMGTHYTVQLRCVGTIAHASEQSTDALMRRINMIEDFMKSLGADSSRITVRFEETTCYPLMLGRFENPDNRTISVYLVE